jgi:propionate CoA-transferase
VVFCGTFAAKTDIALAEGKLNIANRGRVKKLVSRVEQITSNGKYASVRGQQVLYCTERAVFRLIEEGIELTEIAPGADLEADILNMMEFRPKISPDLRVMSRALFTGERIGLEEKFSSVPNHNG